ETTPAPWPPRAAAPASPAPLAGRRSRQAAVLPEPHRAKPTPPSDKQAKNWPPSCIPLSGGVLLGPLLYTTKHPSSAAGDPRPGQRPSACNSTFAVFRKGAPRPYREI